MLIFPKGCTKGQPLLQTVHYVTRKSMKLCSFRNIICDHDLPLNYSITPNYITSAE